MASLIGFDKNRENLEFKGHSKLSLNLMSKYLFVEPENEEFKLISASFKWEFVMKKNLLFVFADFDFLDFCLVFKSEKICKKTFDYIAPQKVDPEPSLDSSFINQIFQKIAENSNPQPELIDVITNWIQLLDEEDKTKYLNLAKTFCIYDIILGAFRGQQENLSEQNPQKNRKRKFAEIKKEETETEERINIQKPPTTISKIIPSDFFQFMHKQNSPNRKLIIFSTSDKKGKFHEYCSKWNEDKFKCSKCGHKAQIILNSDGEICVGMDSKTHSCKPAKTIPFTYQKTQILCKPDYKIFLNCAKTSKKCLVIFDSIDRNLCYEYYWYASNDKFECNGCSVAKRRLRKSPSQARCFNEGTEKEHVEITNNHICEKRKFQLENYRNHYEFILKPNFEIKKFRHMGKERQRLHIFDANDKTKYYMYAQCTPRNSYWCYGCRKLRKSVGAKLRQNCNDEEYVIFLHSKHICEMRSLIPKITLRRPEFEYMEETKKGTPRIFVFVKNDPQKCYTYFQTRDKYICGGCDVERKQRKAAKNGKSTSMVTGKLTKDEKTGEYIFEMKQNQIHICEPNKYEPDLYQVIPKTCDYFYFRQKKNPAVLKVAIIHPQNSNLCYMFAKDRLRNRFYCFKCNCEKRPVRIHATPAKDENGKECFKHNFRNHICQPVKISSIPKNEILKDYEFKFEVKPKRKTIFDESKIVKKPNFQLHPNQFGAVDKKLIVFHPTDKTLYFEYYFIASNRHFRCSKCSVKKLSVTARLHDADEENNESFVVLGKNEHVCQPAPISSSNFEAQKRKETTKKENPKTKIVDESKIIRKPNFKLCPSNSGIPDRKLIVLHSNDKSLCYEYSINKKNFECRKCKSKKVHVSAKIQKADEINDEPFVVLGKNDHVCQPTKYQHL